MRICTYIVPYDHGFAPNPFGEWCSLAACTPNHMGIRLVGGDWLVGFSPKLTGNKLIYAMQVSERIYMNDYFHDARFAYKKPNLAGNWRDRCGDNIYELIDKKWKQSRNRYHLGDDFLRKDTRHPYVFVGKNFWYYGKRAIDVPEQFKALIPDRQGVRTNHPEHLTRSFIEWMESRSTRGMLANPTSNLDLTDGACSAMGKSRPQC